MLQVWSTTCYLNLRRGCWPNRRYVNTILVFLLILFNLTNNWALAQTELALAAKVLIQLIQMNAKVKTFILVIWRNHNNSFRAPHCKWIIFGNSTGKYVSELSKTTISRCFVYNLQARHLIASGIVLASMLRDSQIAPLLLSSALN